MLVRWVLSFAVAIVLMVALVLFVDAHNNDSLAPARNPQAAQRADQEAAAVVAQDQAPHVLTVPRGTDPDAAFVRAVSDDMAYRIARGIIDGNLQQVACSPVRGQPPLPHGTLGFTCTATATDVNYDYVGLVTPAARRLVYCKRDPPPVPLPAIPVSRACTA